MTTICGNQRASVVDECFKLIGMKDFKRKHIFPVIVSHCIKEVQLNTIAISIFLRILGTSSAINISDCARETSLEVFMLSCWKREYLMELPTDISASH